MPPLENGLENLRSISPGSSASQEDFWSRNLDCLEYLSLHPSDTASFCSSRVLSQRPPGADRRFRHPLGRLSTLSDNDGEEELQSELQSELAEDEDFAPSEFSANTRMAAEHHLREVEEELQNIFTPTPVELLRVTLIKPPDQGDFGFGLSDGVYEKGVYISALRPGGPGEKSGFLRPYDRILQVGLWYPLVMTDKIGIGFCTRTNNFSCVGLTTRITPGGGGGHCLFEGNYPLPNYPPRFSGLSAPEFFLPPPIFGSCRPPPSKSYFLNAKLYTKVTPIFPQGISCYEYHVFHKIE